MKHVVTKFIVGMMVIQTAAYSVHAQGAGQGGSVIPGIAGVGGIGGTQIVSGGNYNMQQIAQDNTAIMKQVLDQVKGIQDQDRAYLTGVVQHLNTQIKELIDLQNQMMQLSQKSQLGTIQLTDLLDLGNKIKQKNNALIADIGTSTLITRDMLPSYSPAQAGSMNATIATQGNINMAPLTTKVEGLRAQIVLDTNNLTFKFVLTPLNQQLPHGVSGNALNPDLAGIAIMSPEELEKKEQEIKDLLVPTRKTQGLLQANVELITSMIQNFVNQYGTKQMFTYEEILNSDGTYAAGRNDDLKNIYNAFFLRSYMRKKYGVRLGTFRVEEYNKNILGLDVFIKQPAKQALTMFKNQVVLNDDDIMNSFNNARMWVETLDKKTSGASSDVKIAGAGSAFSGKDKGFFARANTFITKATGQQEVSEVLLVLLKLQMADIEEEKLMARQEKEALVSLHDMQFAPTAEARKVANQKICQDDFFLPAVVYTVVKTDAGAVDEAKSGACARIGVTRKAVRPQQTGKSVIGVFADTLGALENVEKNRRSQADQTQLLVDAARESLKTDTQKSQELEDANDLLK